VPVVLDISAVLGLPRIRKVASESFWTNVTTNLAKSAGSTPVLAIIDDGCAFANAAFRAGPKLEMSRVKFLWDQGHDYDGDHPPKYWRRVQNFDYGRELLPGDIDKVLKDCRTGAEAEVDEDLCYRVLDYPLEGATFAHGTAVMGLAGGSPNPLHESGSVTQDAAAKAPIIFVQLPRLTMADTSGGSLSVHLLDALRYIDERTTERSNPDKKTPLVVNISLGAIAGPHDGDTLIEQAIDDFLEHRPDTAIVIAAGNARDKCTHARTEVPADAGGFVELDWLVDDEDPHCSYVELWWDQRPAAAVNLMIRLVPPAANESESPWVAPGQAWFIVDGAQEFAICGVVNQRNVPNGPDSSMALCSVAPTGSDGELERPLAPGGRWRIQILNTGTQPAALYAWVERDDDSQSSFVDSEQGVVRTDMTLGSIANGRRTTVVGGYIQDDRSGDHAGPPSRALSPSSGEGPARGVSSRQGPDFVAPSDESSELTGLLTCGVHSAEFVRFDGTSAAAAVAARRAYNLLAAAAAAGKSGRSWREVKDELLASVDYPRETSEPVSRVGVGWMKPG